MIKLSIIIPIYKVEKYIVECIESICCQLVEGVEVILVNDGTPDNSMLMAKEYINERYSQYLNQFVFINQNNQGLSGARNQGIAISQGEYIAFLDSDDKLQKNYFNKILNVILENNVDLIQFNALRFDDAENYSVFLKNNITNGLTQLDDKVLNSIFENSSWFAWLRVYKRKLFEKDLFPVGRNYEDAFLVPRIVLKSKNIYFLNENLIGYRLNREGITFNYSEKNMNDLQWVLLDMINRIEFNSLYIKSAISLSKYYLKTSLKTEGLTIFWKRSVDLKSIFHSNGVDFSDLKSVKDKFFIFHGAIFILLIKMIGRE